MGTTVWDEVIAMGINIREKPKGSGKWWIFINHKLQRRSLKIGPNKELAERIADNIRERLILGTLNLHPKREIQDLDYILFLELQEMANAISWLRGISNRANISFPTQSKMEEKGYSEANIWKKNCEKMVNLHKTAVEKNKQLYKENKEVQKQLLCLQQMATSFIKYRNIH